MLLHSHFVQELEPAEGEMLADERFYSQILSQRRDVEFAKAGANVFAVGLAARFFRIYHHRLSKSAASEARALIKAMPSYSYVLLLADRKLGKFKSRLSKRRSAKKARRTASYRIGPIVKYGNRPVTRTLMGYAEDFARNHAGGVRNAWNDLEGSLRSISSDFVKNDAEDDPRRDAYQFTIDGHVELLRFGKFEKAFTRSRRPAATIAELLRKVPRRCR